MRIAAGLVLSVLAAQALAATVTWTNPTTYTDGSPLVVADIASTTVEWSVTQAFTTVAGSVVVNGSASTATAPDPAAGATLCYRARTTVVASKGGGQSAPSNVACKTGAFPPPNPPTNLVVTGLNLVAYGSQQSDERQVVYPVGTVAENTPCDGTMSANGLYRVPKSAVTWAGSVRPPVVFANCTTG